MTWDGDKTTLGATTTGSEWNDMVAYIKSGIPTLGNIAASAISGLDGSDITTGTISSTVLPTVPVTKGGSGLTSVTADSYLKGNGTSNLVPRTYAEVKSDLTLNNVTNESKATMFTSPTFTGTVTIPTPFTLGAVSVTADGNELNYVDGVTSNIQTQLNGKVGTSGNETINGIKTFGSFPVTPSSAPSTDYQVANKKYIDDQIIAAGSGTVTSIATTNGITGGTITTTGTLSLDATYTPTFAGLNLGSGNLNTVENIYLDANIISEGDTNTYHGFHAADQWRVVTGGTERIEVNNNGIILSNTGATINEFSTDGTLAGDSDTAVPTEKATKAYVDGKIATSNTLPYTYKTTTYTATTDDGLILCNGTFTVNTPATAKIGQVLTIKNWGTGVITINPDASDKIDNSTANVTLNSQYSFIQILRADEDDWLIIGGGTYLS